MILKIEGKDLVIEASLGFDDSLKFQVRFPISEVKKLLNGEKFELFEISESEDSASSSWDGLTWGDNL